MLSTLLLFNNKITELFGNPTFWFGLIIAIGLVGVILLCIKYWKQGGKTILFSLFVLVNLVFSAYCLIQLRFYYSTRGGIHGAITGIFNTNEVKVVDNITFEFTNMELTDRGDGTYVATILSDEVLSLDGQENIGVYVNELPCSYVEYAGDYVIADYVYTFLDENKEPLCTDTLTMRFAFYDNSTSLSVSTSGGATAVKYWNYYFNKNEFKVRIGESELMYTDELIYASGDVSQYHIATFVLDNETILVQAYTDNSVVTFPTVTNKHTDWTVDDVVVGSNYKITADTTFVSTSIYEYEVTLYVNDEEYSTHTIVNGVIDFEFPTVVYNTNVLTECRYVIDGWSLDKENIVDLSTLEIINDIELNAIVHTEYYVLFNIADTTVKQWVIENSYAEEPEIPEYFKFECWSVINDANSPVDIASYPITKRTRFYAHGEYLQSVNFYVDDEVYLTQSVNYGEMAIAPDEPTKDGYTFYGWSLDKATIIDLTTYRITGECSFYAIFKTSDEVGYTVRVNQGWCYVEQGETDMYVSVGDEKTFSSSNVIQLYSDSSIISSFEFVIETDGEYSITTNSIANKTITFTNTTYANILVNILYVSGGSDC